MKKIITFLLTILFPMMVFAFVLGDANGNDRIDSIDYVMIRKHLLNQSTLSSDQFKRADINRDNKITALDYVSIRKIIIEGNGSASIATLPPRPTATPSPTTTPTASPTTKPTTPPVYKPTTVTFIGSEIIGTGLEGKSTLTGGQLSVRNSNTLNLKTNTTYVISYDYVTTAGENHFSVDLYPDTLPQESVAATTSTKYREWRVSSNNGDMGNCQLRFFDDQRGSNENDITISNVLIRTVSTKEYNEGSPFGSLPSISHNGFAWYTDSSCKTKVTTSTIVNKNMTLYACRDSINNTPFVIQSAYEYIVGNFNVVKYGADPSGNQDSTQAFKNAISDASYCSNGGSCGNNGGGVVYIPTGKYKLTSSIYLPEHIALVGELKEGTTQGTILMIDHGKGLTSSANAAIKVGRQAMVKNIAFWYPNQKISNNEATKYPPTISQTANEGLTLENLNFVNSYIAMDFATDHFNNALQFVKNIYGTPLNIGILNDTNLDTIKLENVHFSANYWLNSNLANTPSRDSLSKVLMNSSTKPSAFIFERVDWYFLSNISADGYYNGILFRKSSRDASHGGAEGEMYDIVMNNCYYPIYISFAQHMAITSATLKSNGGAALYVENGASNPITINSSNLSSTGSNVIYTANSKKMSITNSTINGRINRTNSNGKIAFINNTLSNTGFDNYNAVSINKGPSASSYNRKVTTKPSSTNIVVVRGSNNEDITSKINNAVSGLSNGGIVYIPSGNYRITGKINVKSGVEIQGVTPWAQSNGPTKLLANDSAYFYLNSKSGINGLAITYDYPNNPESVSASQKRYVIQGSGSNIYVMNMGIVDAWKGVHLSSSDNHYINHIYGTFLNNGITVDGGSKNGIIRDSHFTTNTLVQNNDDKFKKSYKYILENQVSFEIGDTTNQVLLNSFVWGTSIGYKINNGANGFTIIGGGCDMGNNGVTINGTINGQLVNMLLTTKPINSFAGITINTTPSNNHYIATNNGGYVNIINPIFWGNDKPSAVSLSGIGDIHINGGIVENSGTPIIKNGIAGLSIFGIIINQSSNTTIQHVSGSRSANYTCPLCANGKCNINNGANIAYGHNTACEA